MKTEASTELMKFLSQIAKRLGVGNHVYVVGGAPRNFLIGKPIKDVDVVIDSVALKGKDSEWFAKQLQRSIPAQTNLTTNQYGVAILTVSGPWELAGHSLKGEVIEIANARKETYGGPSGKGYKPDSVEPATIEEDLCRREFTFNCLLWRLSDLENGPERAEVLDLLGTGRKDLDNRILTTPLNPDRTFSDDPTRILRTIKFVSKYGFKIPTDVQASIQRNAKKLMSMPWDAVRKILVDDILDGPSPRRSVKLMNELGIGDVLKDMLKKEPGFATALARSLSTKEIQLALDLLDLGWTMKTPVSFLDKKDLKRFRAILLENAKDSNFEKKFLEALKKPPIDQVRLFKEFDLQKSDRGMVSPLARDIILSDPKLVENPKRLEKAVEEALSKRVKTASVVVERFLSRS